MRLPIVPLAFAAGVFFQILLAAGPAQAGVAADGVCKDSHEPSASAPPAAPPAPAPVPTPLDAKANSPAGAESYSDVYRILSAENDCSRFFGGPAKAAEAFNRFARQLSVKRLGNSRVALQMKGSYTNYRDTSTGAAYRLFEEAAVNSEGPLGSRMGVAKARGMQIGSFPALTRAARALVLLHELGHLVRKPGGDWLLPNDGGDDRMSERNTKKVEGHCLEQLKAVKD